MLKSIRNSFLAASLLYIALGLVLIVFPGISLNLVCMIIGAVTLIYGITRIVNAVKSDGLYGSRFDLFVGVLLALFGVFLLFTPSFIVSLIPLVLGLYILVDAAVTIKKALDMKALGFEKWWITLAIALVLAVFGLLMVFNPFGAGEVFVIFIGVGFVWDGVSTLVNTILTERIHKS